LFVVERDWAFLVVWKGWRLVVAGPAGALILPFIVIDSSVLSANPAQGIVRRRLGPARVEGWVMTVDVQRAPRHEGFCSKRTRRRK